LADARRVGAVGELEKETRCGDDVAKQRPAPGRAAGNVEADRGAALALEAHIRTTPDLLMRAMRDGVLVFQRPEPVGA